MIEEKSEITVRIPPSAAGLCISDALARMGYTVASPCGGRGTCGKCRVRICDGIPTGPDGNKITPDENGTVPACIAICPTEGLSVAIKETTGLETDKTSDKSCTNYGIALDIGTTTLVAARVNLPDGEITATASCLNPQSAYGADVISRIGAAASGKSDVLHTVIIDAVRGLIGRLCPEENAECKPPVTVAGNATMLHLFAGISPVSMGHYPFEPAYSGTLMLNGDGLGLPVGNITLLPSASAFIGGDVTAGMLACGLGQSEKPRLLVDIGTNGEIVLDAGSGHSSGNKLIAASAAAGPALEGANISCGMGGIDGAVCSVQKVDNCMVYSTVGDAPAAGICGSGLIDFTAALLDSGAVDGSGCLEGGKAVLCAAHRKNASVGDMSAVPEVTLTQKDIREIQLAKSAIRAGIEAVLDAAGMTPVSFIIRGGRVLLAGGLGYRMNPASAVRIGLLPPCFSASVNAAGNTALKGAAVALTDTGETEKMRKLAGECRVIELEKSAVFNDGFIEYMNF